MVVFPQHVFGVRHGVACGDPASEESCNFLDPLLKCEFRDGRAGSTARDLLFDEEMVVALAGNLRQVCDTQNLMKCSQ